MQCLKNTVQLIGVSNAPQIRLMANGIKQANLSVATSESYKTPLGDKVTETQRHSLVAIGKIAELIEKRVSRGSNIAIEGKLCTRSFINKDGVKIHKTEIQIRELLLLEPKGQELKDKTESSASSASL